MQNPHRCNCPEPTLMRLPSKRTRNQHPGWTDHRPLNLTVICLNCGAIYRSASKDAQDLPKAPTNWSHLSRPHLNYIRTNPAAAAPEPPTETEQPDRPHNPSPKPTTTPIGLEHPTRPRKAPPVPHAARDPDQPAPKDLQQAETAT